MKMTFDRETKWQGLRVCYDAGDDCLLASRLTELGMHEVKAYYAKRDEMSVEFGKLDRIRAECNRLQASTALFDDSIC